MPETIVARTLWGDHASASCDVADPAVSTEPNQRDQPFKALIDARTQENDRKRCVKDKGSQRCCGKNDEPTADHIHKRNKAAVSGAAVDTDKAACMIAGADQRYGNNGDQFSAEGCHLRVGCGTVQRDEGIPYQKNDGGHAQPDCKKHEFEWCWNIHAPYACRLHRQLYRLRRMHRLRARK